MAVFGGHRLLWLRVLCERLAVLLALQGESEGGGFGAIYTACSDVRVGLVSDGCAVCVVVVSGRLLRAFAVEEPALIAAAGRILEREKQGLFPGRRVRDSRPDTENLRSEGKDLGAYVDMPLQFVSACKPKD